MPETKRDRLISLKGQLKKEASSWQDLWRELDEYIIPGRARFDTSDRNRGEKRRQKIINSSGSMAHRTLKSGMHAGITSPARPWFKLETPDPELNQYGPVKQWLDEVGERMRRMFLRSNLYNSLPVIYGDVGGFGVGAMALLSDDQDMMRTYTHPLGSYYLATDGRQRVDTFVREFKLTVRQVVDRFGRYDQHTGQARWDNISSRVKGLYDQGNYNALVDVLHVVSPNPDFNPKFMASKYKRFQSCYLEIGQNDKQFLRESGFDEFPFVCPRWEATGEDVYGTDCPGMIALGDIKSLQLEEKRKAQAIDKMSDPPMTGPAALENAKVSTIPGHITYVNTREGMQGLRPVYQVDPRISELGEDIHAHERRISRAFFEDLFLMLAQSDRREITAREVSERHEEKLLMLGPVLERLNDEMLDPLIDRAFNIMMNRNGPDGPMIPPPPQELQGMDLRVEYISIMAQAQKLVGTASIERFFGFVGNAASVNQEVLDNVDFDEATAMYHEMTGVPASILRSKESVQELRAQRAEAQRAQQQAEAAAQAAQGAKTLSETPTDGDTALTALMRAQGMSR